MHNITIIGKTVSYSGVVGTVLSFYKTPDQTLNLNLEVKDEDGNYVESFTGLTEEEVKNIRII